MIRRYGIFSFFDRYGIVDDYVLFLLNNISKYLSKLTIVCNRKITEEGRKKLQKYSHDIYCCEDSDFDVIAWKKTILHHIGLEALKEYDELVLFNDTIYGPLYSFDIVFNEMESKNVDFWGISANVVLDNNSEIQAINMQRYFTVYNNRILNDERFEEFWSKIPKINNIDETYRYFDNQIIDSLSIMGYKWDTFVNLEGLASKDNNVCYNTIAPDMMIIERKMPFLLRDCFACSYGEILYYSDGSSLHRALRYIEKETIFDTRMIWQNILRIYNIADIKSHINNNNVFSDFVSINDKKTCKCAVIMHLYYKDLFYDTLKLIKNIPNDIHIYITTNNEEKKKIILDDLSTINRKNLEVRIVRNRGRDIAALFVGCSDLFRKYDYLCFTHDKKTTGNIESITIGRDFRNLIMKNVLSSKNYINQVIDAFDKEPCLGILSSPPPIHGIYFLVIGNAWTCCYKQTLQLYKKLKLNVPLSAEKEPIVLGTSFWCRTKALMPIIDAGYNYEDFPSEPLESDGTINHAFERILPYVAQNEGYYSTYCMTEEYASLMYTDYKYIAENTIRNQNKESDIGGKNIENLSDLCFEVHEVITSFYFDDGYSYSEGNKISCQTKIKNCGLSISQKGINKKNIKSIRFDPLEYGYYSIKIEEITINNTKTNIKKIRTNAYMIKNETYFFGTNDPQIEIILKNRTNVNDIMIKGKISNIPTSSIKAIPKSIFIIKKIFYYLPQLPSIIKQKVFRNKL